MSNSKDINDILDEVFSRSSGGKSRAAIEAEEFLSGISKTGKSKAAKDAGDFLLDLEKTAKELDSQISRDLERQTREIKELNAEVKVDLTDIQKNLQEDGFDTEKVEEEIDYNDVFSRMFECVSKEVIGQDEFLKDLIKAFKRPFVMGFDEGSIATSIIVTGKTGTGRGSALKNCIKYLTDNKLIKGEKAQKIDLSLYASAEDGKLFLQDLFGATQSKDEVIIFENYDKCHKSLLGNVKEVVLAGKVQLGSRYANQKGMLIDVGTALVSNAISSVSCEGKYIIFLTGHHKSKIVDNMGSPFVSSIADICTTNSFEADDLKAIAEKTLRELLDKCKDKLGFTFAIEENIQQFFASQFTLTEGVNSLEAFSDKCYKMLSEYKLDSSVKEQDFTVEIENGTLSFVSGETRITVENKVEDNTALDDVKAQFGEIVGLSDVKEYVFSLEDNYKLNNIRKSKGLKAESPSMHMIFTGNPGTGKTTIARLVSRYLKAIGVLTGGQLIEVTRADLVGRYVGHTAPLTKQVIESAIGGVLFIDEAYSLCRGADDSFGLESIDTLVKGMEDNRDNLIVILAGYTKEMEEFLKSNSGLESRFPNMIEFQDYTADELMKITDIIVKNKGYKLSGEVEDVLVPYYQVKQEDNSRTAGNGRMARNMVENAILNQSKRLLKENSENYEELTIADFEI